MHTATETIRIVIADDHEIFRDGFRALLKRQKRITLVGEAGNGSDLLDTVEQLKPDVVITDIRMPHMDGIAATHQMQQRFPHIGVIALSMFDEEQLILEMLEAGAKGYLLKNATKEEMIDAIEAVHAGEIYFCRSTSPKLAQLIGESRVNPFRKKSATELNEREKEIVRLLCEEFSSKEIAARVNLTVRTVETYRMSILEKVGARNVAGLVVYAIKHGLFKL